MKYKLKIVLTMFITETYGRVEDSTRLESQRGEEKINPRHLRRQNKTANLNIPNQQ